jgi:hypothetical protein
LGGIPADTVVFDTAIVTEINQTEYGKLTDVGSIDGQARSQDIAQKPYLASFIALCIWYLVRDNGARDILLMLL